MSRDTATPPSPISLPTANGAVTAITPSQVFTATVYDDQPNPNWSLQATSGMEFDQANTTHAHSGHTSVAMTPHEDFSKLSFIVNQTADTVYPRDRVVAVSFWLNSGNEPLSLTDLGVSMMGSNAHPYWVANDTSVVDETKINFQETRLYDLGINRSIPPETWVQVFVYPNKLIYDPLYKYVTGFYIKNDAGFLRTVYIDDVNLLMISDNTQPTNTVIPSEIASPTPTVTPGPDLLTPTATPEPTATRDFSPTFTVRPTIRPSATSTPKR